MSDQANDKTSDQNQAFDKVDLHNRQQLSALMDGALAPDEARFLLRRLQHDGELSECWERWQLAGEVMRGRATVVLPRAFAARVGEAIAADATMAPKTPAPRARWVRWGGSVALAASVAVVALLATRQAPDVAPAGQAASIAVTTPAPTVEPVAPVAPPASPPAPMVTQPADAGSRVASVAVADAPRRVVQRGRSAQRPRMEARAPIPAAEEARTDVVIAPIASSAQTQRPFDAGTLPSSRPWPRAVLPQFGASGALTAGTDASTSPSFYPFEPRLPEDAVEPDTTPAQPR